MWGSNWTDLAKKAQELQEQASEAASSISHVNTGVGFNTSSLFNLDAIRQIEETTKPPPAKKHDPHADENGGFSSMTSVYSMGSIFQSIPPAVTAQSMMSPGSNHSNTGTGGPKIASASGMKLKVPATKSTTGTSPAQTIKKMGTSSLLVTPPPATAIKSPLVVHQQPVQTASATTTTTPSSAQLKTTSETKPTAPTIVEKETIGRVDDDDDKVEEDGDGWGGDDDVDIDDDDEENEDEQRKENTKEGKVASVSTPDAATTDDQISAIAEKAKIQNEEETSAAKDLDSQNDPSMESTNAATTVSEEKKSPYDGHKIAVIVEREPGGQNIDDGTAAENNAGTLTATEVESSKNDSVENEGLQEEEVNEQEMDQNEGDEIVEEETADERPIKNDEMDSPVPLADEEEQNPDQNNATEGDVKSASVGADEEETISDNDASLPPSPAHVLMDRSMDDDDIRDEDKVTENDADTPVSNEEENDAAATHVSSSNDAAAGATAPPDDILEHFSKQMQRLEENHQAEKAEMKASYTAQIQQMQAEFNHDECDAMRRAIEQSLQAQIREKEDQLHDLMRANEGMKLKLDVLKREVEGTQKLLEAKQSDMGKATEQNLRNLRDMEKLLVKAEEQASKFEEEKEELKNKLESMNEKHSSLEQEHADLKERVKGVATELKDRRVECRELQSVIEEKNKANEKLNSEIESLRFQLTDQDRSRSLKDGEMGQLESQLNDALDEIKKAKKAMNDQEAQAEKVLADYKRKAQSSLALANSRAATAIQAKEEAELEARAARSTADTAMERAVAAEIASKSAIAEAKAYAKELEQKTEKALKDMGTAKEALQKSEKILDETKEQLKKSNLANEKLSEALASANKDIEESRRTTSSLQEELERAQIRANGLKDDIATLREQLVRAEAAAQSETKKEIQDEVLKSTSSHGANSSAIDASDDATLRILQEELSDANKTIEELKEALASAVASNEQQEKLVHLHGGAPAPRAPVTSNGDNTSTPLFYAMEKQAELNTARDEINRLANLLSTVQSEKMEAYESMEDMRKRMEDAEARLKRYEKLSSLSDHDGTIDAPTAPSSNGSGRRDSGAVNIEYLKHIMMRYLTAKTTAEKKSLVPVIGAVLCLTSDEQQTALRNLEASTSLGGVGSSLFESISSSLM